MDNSVNITALNNVAIVKQFFKYYEKNDILGLREIFSPEIEWHVPGHHPLAGTKKGIEEVIAYYKQLQKANFKAEVIVLEGNDRTAVGCVLDSILSVPNKCPSLICQSVSVKIIGRAVRYPVRNVRVLIEFVRQVGKRGVVRGVGCSVPYVVETPRKIFCPHDSVG